MSIQAVAWALEQNIPGTAKLVLISLANCADHQTGHCWPSMERIAREASCSRRSVFTYVGALRRNGFVDVRTGRGKTGGAHTNDYWLLMDRAPNAWDFGKGGEPDEPDDPQDIVCATVADTKMQHETDGEVCANIAHSSHTVCATRLQTEPSLSEPSESFPVEGRDPPPMPQSTQVVSPPPALAPPDFDPNARKAEQARLQAAEEARSKKQMFPVIQGTKSWEAWIVHGHKPTLVTTVIVNGKHHRGWYFPTLFPPKSTGPPSSLMTAADHEELTRGL